MDKNYFAITDTGRIRHNNEDAFIAERTTDGKLVIACVIDGVGGYSGGEIASEIARSSIIRRLNSPTGDLMSKMKSAIVMADQEILTEKLKVAGHEKMACVLTLAVVDLSNNQFHYAHVGDTRLYLLRDNSLVKISKDQSFVGFMEDSGRITEEQAMAHPKRNEINKALGFGHGLATQPDYIEMGTSPFLPGDMLLICSDGLSDMLTRQHMTDILTSNAGLETMGRELISAANNQGGRDNITLVLVKNDKEAIQHGATKPVRRKLAPTESRQAEEADTRTQKASSPRPKKSRGMLVLIILCILLLASTLYLLWDKYSSPENKLAPGTLQPYQLPPGLVLPDTTIHTDSTRVDSLQKTDSLSKPAER